MLNKLPKATQLGNNTRILDSALSMSYKMIPPGLGTNPTISHGMGSERCFIGERDQGSVGSEKIGSPQGGMWKPGHLCGAGCCFEAPYSPHLPGKDSLLEDWNHPHGPACGASENALHAQNQEPRGQVGTELWASMEYRPHRFFSSRTFQSLS